MINIHSLVPQINNPVALCYVQMVKCSGNLNSPSPQLPTWLIDAPYGFDVLGIYEIVNGCCGAGNEPKEIFMDLVRAAFES